MQVEWLVFAVRCWLLAFLVLERSTCPVGWPAWQSDPAEGSGAGDGARGRYCSQEGSCESRDRERAQRCRQLPRAQSQPCSVSCKDGGCVGSGSYFGHRAFLQNIHENKS